MLSLTSSFIRHRFLQLLQPQSLLRKHIGYHSFTVFSEHSKHFPYAYQHMFTVELRDNSSLKGETSCSRCHIGTVPSIDRQSCKLCDPAAPICTCSQSTVSDCPTKSGWNPSIQFYRLDYGGIQLDSSLLRASLPEFTLACKVRKRRLKVSKHSYLRILVFYCIKLAVLKGLTIHFSIKYYLTSLTTSCCLTSIVFEKIWC